MFVFLTQVFLKSFQVYSVIKFCLMSELQSHGKCLNLQGLLQPKFHDAVAVILKLEWHQSPLVGLVKTAELTPSLIQHVGAGPENLHF